jgi:hypothetical protein
MARKVHPTRYAEPSSKRIGSISLRSQFRLSVREVAGLLRHPEIAQAIPESDAALYKKHADCNLTRAELAKSQGVSESSLGLLLYGIERDILREALFLGFLRVTVSDTPSEPIPAQDTNSFEQGHTREMHDELLTAEWNGVREKGGSH